MLKLIGKKILTILRKNKKNCLSKRKYLLTLQMNDFMRDKLMNRDGSIPIWAEIISGGMVCTAL